MSDAGRSVTEQRKPEKCHAKSRRNKDANRGALRVFSRHEPTALGHAGVVNQVLLVSVAVRRMSDPVTHRAAENAAEAGDACREPGGENGLGKAFLLRPLESDMVTARGWAIKCTNPHCREGPRISRVCHNRLNYFSNTSRNNVQKLAAAVRGLQKAFCKAMISRTWCRHSAPTRWRDIHALQPLREGRTQYNPMYPSCQQDAKRNARPGYRRLPTG